GGSPGTRYIIEHGPIADMAIVGEPTKLEVVVAHKTGCNVKIRTVGRSTHTSVPHKGVNAIVKMSKLIEAVEEELPKKLSAKTHKFLGTSTHCACLISGGVHHGVVPDSCELIINLRLIPGETQESIRKYFKEIIEDIEKKDPEFKAEVEVSPVGKYLETNENHQIVHALKDSIRDVMKKEPTVTGVPYWTDGALLSSDGNIPTIVYGPGNIEQAHSSVEFVSIKETLIATRVLTLTALRVCGRANLV
ncbi:MAG: M20/M25/M40 family metallo-hydrolase, partial [Candidatus Bathyarchaeia archaeon]